MKEKLSTGKTTKKTSSTDAKKVVEIKSVAKSKTLTSIELVAKSTKIKTKTELFDLIASMLQKAGHVKNKNDVLNDLVEREKLGSTAFENGLIIPHARVKSIKETKIVIVEFNDQDFESIDGNLTNLAVSIIVPQAIEGEHMKVLSKISQLLSTKESLLAFKKLSNEEKVKVINDLLVIDDVPVVETSGTYDFVAVTSCAAGIAHTYMARDALINAAKKLGLKAKVETRGITTENRLTPQDIDGAKFVIIAADVAIPKTQFAGKKLLVVETNDAIKNAEKVIELAKQQQVTYGKGENIGKLKMGTTSKTSLGKAVMSAISFMIPIVIVGGIMMAIPNALAAGGNKSGGTWKFPNAFTEALWNFGHIGLLMMVPILSMFLAYRIGGKPAMPAALIGGFFINDGAIMGKFSIIDLPKDVVGNASAGYLGGLAVGIFVGYIVKWMQWIKWHKSVKPIANLMFVPLLSGFITYIFVLYVIGSPMTYVMAQLYKGLASLSSEGVWVNMLIGMLFAGCMSVDLGGPINKTALVVATMIFTDTLVKGTPNFVPQTAVQAAGSTASIGMWGATMLFGRKFSLTEKAAGKAALPMGLVGISEGALPFAFATPLKAIIANVTGSAVAGGLVSLANLHFYGGLGSPLAAGVGYIEPLAGEWKLVWIACTLCGALVTAILYGLLRKRVPEYEQLHNEQKAEKRAAYAKIGLNTRVQISTHLATNFVKKIPAAAKYAANPKHWFERPSGWGTEGDSEL